MRRGLLIFLSLVLALVGWSTVCAEDGFYVVPVMKGKYAPVPKTGQTHSYVPGDDGDLQKGVAWPTPRFTDNNNGTVTDNLTGLIWMKNANAFGMRTWAEAISTANGLQTGSGWPHGRLQGGRLAPAQPPGTAKPGRLWQICIPPCRTNHPFTGVQGTTTGRRLPPQAHPHPDPLPGT